VDKTYVIYHLLHHSSAHLFFFYFSSPSSFLSSSPSPQPPSSHRVAASMGVSRFNYNNDEVTTSYFLSFSV